jgi:hypothetical protein
MSLPVGSSDAWSQSAEELHQTLGEGPPVLAQRTGRAISVESVSTDDDRWPAWAGVAAAHGVHAITAIPLPTRGAPIGTLTWYWSRTPVPTTDMADAWLVVEMAEGLLWADADRIVQNSTDEVDGFGMIPVAAGMVSSRLGISIEAAGARLRAHAFANNCTVKETAQAVVERRIEF